MQVLADGILDADDAVLDGEVVAFDSSGVPSFSRLQQRMNTSGTSSRTGRRAWKDLVEGVPIAYIAFDLLALNGLDCTPLPYRQRRELLEEVLQPEEGSPILVPPAFEDDVHAALTASRELRLEGIVAKRHESPYRAGSRSEDWLKFSHLTIAEVIVVGWRESEAQPDGLASLLVAVPREDELVYAGRVGTGFSEADRSRIRGRLERLERKTPAVEVPADVRRDAHWVTPKLVGEVKFREQTPDGRLRHPVWRGWRTDKELTDVTPI